MHCAEGYIIELLCACYCCTALSCCVHAMVWCVLQEAEKQQLQQQQASFMSEVEEWSQGEVEAIQAAADTRLHQQQQQVEHW